MNSIERLAALIAAQLGRRAPHAARLASKNLCKQEGARARATKLAQAANHIRHSMRELVWLRICMARPSYALSARESARQADCGDRTRHLGQGN